VLASISRSHCDGGSRYATLEHASQNSVPPSSLHPRGPRSHSAQANNFNPFAGAVMVMAICVTDIKMKIGYAAHFEQNERVAKIRCFRISLGKE
jgi:hypothetical protein